MTRELKLRTLSASVMIPAALAATWAGGSAFCLLSVLIGLGVFYEWAAMTRLNQTSLRGLVLGWVALVTLAANLAIGDHSMSIPLFVGWIVTLVLLCLFCRWSLWLAGGVAYCGFAMIALSAIRADDSMGFVAMLFVFVTVWSTDILAYFIGRALKGPKLAPRISPGKTWSGAIGGTISGALGGFLVASYYFSTDYLWVPFVAALLSITSQMGDLFESFIKRKFGVKDSGRLIPGHGGIMDRVDGLVTASFTAFIIAMCIGIWRGGVSDSLGFLLFDLAARP